MNTSTYPDLAELVADVETILVTLQKLSEQLDESSPDYRSYDEKRFDEFENMHGPVEALVAALKQRATCQVCGEPIRPHVWIHQHNDIYCGTGDGASATPSGK
ncbi:hypothetical protein ACWZHB_01290 [Nocardia sp. FBN12]|uniref:hypothetical protein n=1 Tax=Nocardia sp. FBN12 TaxID=3419766 RepID=UPI003D00CD66